MTAAQLELGGGTEKPIETCADCAHWDPNPLLKRPVVAPCVIGTYRIDCENCGRYYGTVDDKNGDKSRKTCERCGARLHVSPLKWAYGQNPACHKFRPKGGS